MHFELLQGKYIKTEFKIKKIYCFEEIIILLFKLQNFKYRNLIFIIL